MKIIVTCEEKLKYLVFSSANGTGDDGILVAEWTCTTSGLRCCFWPSESSGSLSDTVANASLTEASGLLSRSVTVITPTSNKIITGNFSFLKQSSYTSYHWLTEATDNFIPMMSSKISICNVMHKNCDLLHIHIQYYSINPKMVPCRHSLQDYQLTNKYLKTKEALCVSCNL